MIGRGGSGRVKGLGDRGTVMNICILKKIKKQWGPGSIYGAYIQSIDTISENLT